MRILLADDSDYIVLVEERLKKNEVFFVRTIRTLKDLRNPETLNGIDVIILDMQFSTDRLAGLNVLPQLLAAQTDVKILIYSTHIDKPIVEAAREKGAIGYIYKNDRRAIENMEEILEDIANGIAMKFINWSSESVRDLLTLGDDEEEYKLKDYQLDILKSKAEGYTSTLIADQLNEKYVETYYTTDVDNFLKAISGRWNIINDKAAIVAMAIVKGLIDINNLNFVRR